MGQVRPPDGSIQDTRLSWHLPSPSHERLHRGVKWSQRAAEQRGRRQQQFRQLHSFSFTLIKPCPHLWLCALSSHVINLSGPPLSLILIIIASKSLHAATVSNIIALSTDLRVHWDYALGSQSRSLPCMRYLYSIKPYSRVTNPCCCNKHGKGAITGGLENSWLQWSLQYGSQMPGSEPSSSRTNMHVKSVELSVAWTLCTWKSNTVWCCLRNSSRDNRTYMVQGKFSHWNITWLVQRPRIILPLQASETSLLCFPCLCSSNTKSSLHT